MVTSNQVNLLKEPPESNNIIGLSTTFITTRRMWTSNFYRETFMGKRRILSFKWNTGMTIRNTQMKDKNSTESIQIAGEEKFVLSSSNFEKRTYTYKIS